MTPRHGQQSGQAMVEFSIVVILLFTLVLGLMDLAYFFSGKVAVGNAVRAAARFAATKPTAWDPAANPSSTSIQGQLEIKSAPESIVNDDAHIVITYLIPGTGSAGVACGQYRSAAPAGFVAATGYTQSTCIFAGNLVTVQATYNYGFITPMMQAAYRSPTIVTHATEILEGNSAPSGDGGGGGDGGGDGGGGH